MAGEFGFRGTRGDFALFLLFEAFEPFQLFRAQVGIGVAIGDVEVARFWGRD